MPCAEYFSRPRQHHTYTKDDQRGLDERETEQAKAKRSVPDAQQLGAAEHRYPGQSASHKAGQQVVEQKLLQGVQCYDL